VKRQIDEQVHDYEKLIVPKTWEVVQLKDVCHKITDGTHKTPKYQKTGVRFVSITNIRPYQPIIWENYIKYISREEHNELIKRCNPEYDDILFPRIGTLGFAKRIDFKEEVSIFVGLGLLKPVKEIILPKYLEYWMNHPLIHKLSHEKATGSGRLTLPLEETRKFPVPIAPPNQQKLIVAEIEKQFSRLDEAVAALKRIQANLKRYKASVLKAAVEGKLTEEWRSRRGMACHAPTEDEPADLLKRILTERKKKWGEDYIKKYVAAHGHAPKDGLWKKKYKEPAGPNATDLPQLPEGWTAATIEQLLFSNKDALKTGPFGSLLKKHEHQTSGVAVLGIENIQAMHFIRGSKIHINEKKAHQLEGYRALPGDILISRSGTVGEVCVVPEDIGDVRISTNLIKVSLAKNGMLPEWFIFLFNGSPFVLGQVKELCKGSSRLFLNQDILRQLIFVLPPLEEQNLIIREVHLQFTVVTTIENGIESNLKRAERLRQAILKKAFSGRLISQSQLRERASA
jgi:type I restriction enzyme, S subunit